jgi:hypothetical protein
MITRLVGVPNQVLVFSLHNKETPTAEEWDEYVRVLAEAMGMLKGDSSGIRGLSISDGGAPNARQREQVNAFMRRHTKGRGYIAIVTSDSIVRGIVKALSWFNPYARAFAPGELEQAIEYLRLTPELRQLFEPALREALLVFPIESMPS